MLFINHETMIEVTSKTRILIEEIEQETKTEGGILIPEAIIKTKSDEENIKLGIIYAMNAKEISEYVLGQKVLFFGYGPRRAKIEGKLLWVAKLEDIIGIIK